MSEPWRLRCPDGHAAWRTYGDQYYCTACESKFGQLTDAKTGRDVDGAADLPQLVTDGGTAELPTRDSALEAAIRDLREAAARRDKDDAEEVLQGMLSHVRKEYGGEQS
jgi:hypothetical protein